MSSTGGTVAVNMDFVKSPLGIIEIAEAVVSLITFICAMIWRTGEGAEWVQFVSIIGFLLALAFFLMNLLNAYSKMGNAPWYLIEFIVHAVWSVFFLIAGIVAAAASAKYSPYSGILGNTYNGIAASAFFCFLALIIWVLGTVLLFKRWREAGGAITTTSTTTTTTTTVESGKPT